MFGSKAHLGSSLLGEYSRLLGDAVLRHEARRLEETARAERQLAEAFRERVTVALGEIAGSPLTTLVEFSDFLKQRSAGVQDRELIETYARLVELAALRLLASFDEILVDPSVEVATS
jgi:hypothetical protein